MSRYSLLLSAFFLFALVCCDNDTGRRNPYLQEIRFRYEINLNLPLYSPLLTTGNPVYIGNTGVGIRGVFVMNAGFDIYRAFEASCPNHAPNTCSTMSEEGQMPGARARILSTAFSPDSS
jgi:hypothetical protein